MANNKKNQKKIENEKKQILHKVLATIAFILSIGYLTYTVISLDNIITNLDKMSVALFIFIISLIIFIYASKSKKSRAIYVLSSIVLIIFTSFFLINDLNIIKLPAEEQILSLENKSYKKLNDFANLHNIELITEYEYSETIAKGNIIRTDVKEGTYVKDITKINVVISDGPDYDKLLIVPSMIGWNIDEVVEYINENFLNNVIINYEKSDDEKDYVIRQDRNGELRRNQELTLTLSLGNEELPETVEIIDLTNKSLFDALLWLKRNGINYETTYEFNNNVERNSVISAEPKSGEINISNDKILLTISKGTAMKTPDFTKMTVKDATEWAINNNIKLDFNEVYDEEIETGKIIKQSIDTNTDIEINTLITLTISKGQIKMEEFSSLSKFKEWANKYNIKYNENYEYSNTINKGNIISFNYNVGDIVDPDGIINVKVSLGKAVVIPSFVGKTKTEAQNTCYNLGIKCSFTTGDYNTNYKENVVYGQSRGVNTKTAAGSTITLTLSKGTPTTYKLAILQNWLSIGNADNTISSLRTQLSKQYPGVNFEFKKVPDNTLNSGMISESSPCKAGNSITQGKTCTIYIVSN